MAREIEAEVRRYAPAALTAVTLLLLRDLADSANHDDRIVCLSNHRMSRDTRSSEKSVQRAIKALEGLNIIETVPEDEVPERTRKYPSVSRRILPREEWKLIFDQETGEDVVQTNCRPPRTNCPEEGGQFVRDEGDKMSPEPNTYNQLPSNQFFSAPPAAEKNSARTTPRTQARRSSTQRKNDDDGLDAADAFREDPEPTPAPQNDAGHLVFYFKEQLLLTPAGREALKVPDAIVFTAMVKKLRSWMSGEHPLTAAQIKAMINAYVKEGPRPGFVPWVDFIYRRAPLMQLASKALVSREDPFSQAALDRWGVTAEDLTLYDKASNQDKNT
ncbi:hypothetical protein FDA94_29130 [Herbidospora galbida]|uniref:Helix-turn-helix domain-containing protein n=1 Tax=Herbidospora galbida TaxID=2575442 RepID=A0A4U3M8U0_9ACTN|nr:hypothetical protein [Herbidospora galbida]TKK84679.1 hypothetical protein FDA94_29130 [Herbidospora galbida]